MPWFVFKTSGSYSWQPSLYGISDGDSVRFHAVGAGGDGGNGNGVSDGGGGGGGGERRSEEVTISTASDYLDVRVDLTGGSSCYVKSASLTTYVEAWSGSDASSSSGGAGGSGGTGSLISHSGGAGGNGGTGAGGGGGESGRDGSTGNAGASGDATVGGAGGASTNQIFNAAGYGSGGDGANLLGSPSAGDFYGGGGGGGDLTGSGASGEQGLIIAAWGVDITDFPPAPWYDGYLPSPSSGSSRWFTLF